MLFKLHDTFNINLNTYVECTKHSWDYYWTDCKLLLLLHIKLFLWTDETTSNEILFLAEETWHFSTEEKENGSQIKTWYV